MPGTSTADGQTAQLRGHWAHYAEQHLGRADWAEAWRRRIAAIEAEDRPAAERRQALERALAINRNAFCTTVSHGAVTAVLDVTAAVAEADGRLSRLEEQETVLA